MIDSPHSKNINGHTYIVGYLPAMANWNLAVRISAIVGKTLPDIASGIVDSNAAGLGEAFSKLLSSLYLNDPTGDLILEILAQTQRDGKPIHKGNVDALFMGNMGEFIEVAAYSAQVHFAGFFSNNLTSGLGEKLGAIITKALNSAEISPQS